MNRIQLSPSMVCSDLSQLGAQVQILDQAGVDMLHWDIMDGVFVRSFCLTPDVIAACRPFTELPFDVHMCITDPEAFIPVVADASADILSLQFETTPHLFRAIEKIHQRERKAGIVINPKTPISQVELVLGEIQMVTLMTVDVGFAGQQFIMPMLDKIRKLREIIDARGYEIDIQVDGQINFNTFRDVIKAGANVLVVGTSGLFSVDKDLATGVGIVRAEIDAIMNNLE